MLKMITAVIGQEKETYVGRSAERSRGRLNYCSYVEFSASTYFRNETCYSIIL